MISYIKKNELLLVLAIISLFVLPMLFVTHGLIPRLDSDYDSDMPIYAFLIDFVKRNHAFPFIIPFIGTGLPIFGDLLARYYNPFFIIPLFFFGITNGLKITFLLMFMLSGITMWIFLQSVCTSNEKNPAEAKMKIVRVWGSLLYAFSGSFVARIAAGHIEKVLSYPLIPLFLFFILKKHLSFFDALAAGFILALTFFSGDIYGVWFLSIFLLTFRGYYFVTERSSRKATIFSALIIFSSFFIFAVIKWLPFMLFVRPQYERYFSINPYIGSIHSILLPLAFIVPFQTSFYDRPFFQRHLGFYYNWYEYYAFISPLPFIFLLRIKDIYKKVEVKIFLLAILVGALYLGLKYPYSPFYWLFVLIKPLQAIRVPQRIDMPLTAIVIALLVICAQRFIEIYYFKKKIIIACILIGSFLWTYAVTFQTFRNTFVPINRENKKIIAMLRQKDQSKYYVVVFAPQLQTFLIDEKIYVLNYYYGWKTHTTPTFLRKDEKGIDYSLFGKIRPKYIITMKTNDFSKYSYERFLQNNNVIIWKTDTVTMKPMN